MLYNKRPNTFTVQRLDMTPDPFSTLDAAEQYARDLANEYPGVEYAVFAPVYSVLSPVTQLQERRYPAVGDIYVEF